MVYPDFLAEAKKIKPDLVKLRRRLHMYPELGMEEYRTAAIIEETLQAHCIETKRVAGTGVVGLLMGTGKGKTIALRADIDALPLTDAKQVEYASKVPGKMHACGHDVHTAGLLGAAMLLNKCKDQLTGNVKFLFQPAEETTGGALPMIKAGVMAAPQVDAVFGLHSAPEIRVGKIGVSYGKSYAASDMFDVVIQGRSCHGASPHLGVDAILIGSQVVTALQSFVSRNVDPVDAAVVTIGKFVGGDQRNIIADKVELSGIIRTLGPESRERAKLKIKKIIEGVAESLGAEATIQFIPSYPCLINDDEMVDLVKSSAEELLSKNNVLLIEKPTMGVEDFAYFLQQVPGAFFQLGVGNAEKGIVNPLHSSSFDADEDALVVAAAMHARISCSFLERKS